MTATTPLRSSTVDACSQRATKRANAHQRHTRSVQSSSCAEGGFFQSPICIRTRLANPSASYSGSITHILCPAVVVASSPPSEPQLAGHQRQFDVSPDWRPSSAIEACCPRPFSAKRPSPSSASSHPPGSAWLSVPTRVFNHVTFTTAFTAAADWPSLAVDTASPLSLVYRSLRRVIKTVRLSLSWRSDVRSLPWLPVITSFNENPPSLRRLHRCPRS